MFNNTKKKHLEKRYLNIIKKPLPKHIGIILDGNGRWAKKRGLPRIMGHAAGIKRIEAIIPEVKRLGVEVLTLFVFSTENWDRPDEEVNFLMNEAEKIYTRMLSRVKELGYNVRIIGEVPKEKHELATKIKELNELGNNEESFTLCIAFNYGSRPELIQATKNIGKMIKDGLLDVEDINEQLIDDNLYTKGLPPVDLMIRTSGEMRISNFLLWQISYAELYFPKIYWPDFDCSALYEAIENYQKRNRRFGKIGEEDA
ncbi:MAG: di-trans,poly-cis-decaprenylcistransferase [Bacilli bacterium]|nr:di-trans,poly-cis-decaprenylcistransferase [Bacilli bacterium]